MNDFICLVAQSTTYETCGKLTSRIIQNYQKSQYLHNYPLLLDGRKSMLIAICWNIIKVILNHFNVQLTKYLGTLLYMQIGLINITSEYLKGEMHENVLVANVK